MGLQNVQLFPWRQIVALSLLELSQTINLDVWCPQETVPNKGSVLTAVLETWALIAAAAEVRSAVVTGSLCFYSHLLSLSLSVSKATLYMGHLCKLRDGQRGSSLTTTYESYWPPPYFILLHSWVSSGEHLHGAQITSQTVGLLWNPWYNFSLGDLGNNLLVTFKNYQVPGRFRDLGQHISHGAWISVFKGNSIISSFTSSGQPDITPKVLSTRRFPSNLWSPPPRTDTSLNQTVFPVFLLIGPGEFPVRPEEWFEGKAGSSGKSESPASAGNRGAEKTAGLRGTKNNISRTRVQVHSLRTRVQILYPAV